MFERILLRLIRFYQVGVSPFTPPSCRFQPTCSAYAFEAIERHGVWKGSAMAVRRLLRCHPWGGSGYDPVPPPEGGQPRERVVEAGTPAHGEPEDEDGNR